MASRGLHQLKRMQFIFCDYTGASKGVQNLLKSEQLVDFVQQQEHLNFEFILKRNKFPFISCTYLNGFVKDYPLRKLSEEEILQIMERANNSCNPLANFSVGRVPLRHSNSKVIGSSDSIQGRWSPDLWSKEPDHEMQWIRKPEFLQEDLEKDNLPYYEKKVKLHPRVNLGRKKIKAERVTKQWF